MYNTVMYDDLMGLLPMIDTNFGVNGFTNITMGGLFDPAYNPPGGGGPIPAIVWNIGTFPPGAVFAASFTVMLLNPVPQSNFVNTVFLDSDQSSAALQGILSLLVGLSDTPSVSSTKLGPSIVFAGDTFTYILLEVNDSLVTLNDMVILDKIPNGATFNSTWFGDAAASGTIFYATTTNFPDAANPPPPATQTNVTWFAFYIPQMSSMFFPPPGPVSLAAIAIDVTVDQPADPCEIQGILNRSISRVYEFTPPTSTQQVIMGGPLEVQRAVATAVLPERGLFDTSPALATLTPNPVTIPGRSLTAWLVRNQLTPTSDTFTNVFVEIQLSPISVNGISAFPSLVSVLGGTIQLLDPANGRVILELGALAPV